MRNWLAARWQTALIGLLFLASLAGLMIAVPLGATFRVFLPESRSES